MSAYDEPHPGERSNHPLAPLHRFEPGAREEAISTLRALDREAVIRELTGLLNDRDPESRCDASEALLLIDADQAIDRIPPLVTDPVSAVRWNTCGLLHDFGDRRAIPMLVQVLLGDPEGDVRLMAAYALGEIGDHTAVSALRQASQSDDGTDHEGRRVRDAAAEAAERIVAQAVKFLESGCLQRHAASAIDHTSLVSP